MVRLFLAIIIIFLLVWILRPFFITKDNKKTKNTVDRILSSDQSKLGQQNTVLIIISTVILLALVFWLLSKFGVNFFALLQKIIPIVSSLRGILPF